MNATEMENALMESLLILELFEFDPKHPDIYILTHLFMDHCQMVTKWWKKKYPTPEILFIQIEIYT